MSGQDCSVQSVIHSRQGCIHQSYLMGQRSRHQSGLQQAWVRLDPQAVWSMVVREQDQHLGPGFVLVDRSHLEESPVV